MRSYYKLKKKAYGYFFDSSIDAKDRGFVVFSFSEIMALVASLIIGIFLNEPFSSTVSQVIITVACSALLIFAVRSGRIRAAKIFVAFLLVCVFQPLLFFTKGGIHGGATLSILLGSYYLVMVLDGKFRVIMCVLDAIVLSACGIAAYYCPGLVTEYSRDTDYIYTFAKYFLTWLVLAFIISFQTRIYQHEVRLSREKSTELEELNKSQNRFFSSMSHEIRTPINTVLGLNEIILRQEDASEEIKKDARNIQGAGRMLLALINDILDVSKIEAGKMDIVPVNYSVSSMLSEIVNMIWLKAEEKGLAFNVDIDPDVPETLFGDEVRIKQILINLLNNAVKYTKEGSVSLHMECEILPSGDARLNITVSDTGMGIKQEALPHLFDSFQRIDEEKNRHIEGTGLGLSIVKQLVGLMDGEIIVNSVYSQGSTFTVSLKQGVSSDKRIGDLSITNSGSMTNAEKFEHSFHATDAKILIVDDNEMNLQVEKKLLDGTGLLVDLAMSGAEALNKTLNRRYDMIFMDHLMPEMDGIECFEMIRSQKGGINLFTPVVVLTANAGGENIELYNNTGFDGYLVKPVSGRQLEEMLLSYLPADKVVLNSDSDITTASMNTASRYAKKKPLIIATSTLSDLPRHVVRELNISVIPYTLITDEGVFYDSVDIDSEELVRYMRDEKKIVLSEPPTEDAFVSFFSSELQKAHQLIYITLTTGSSREYGWAQNAAKSFENVTIFNSETLSSGTGILVMIAARLAQQNMPVDKIISELEYAKSLIKCSFVIKTTDVMARRELISPFMNNLLTSLWLRPVLRVRNDKLGVGRFLFGSIKRCYEKYIDYAFPANRDPDRSFVFITYAGMEEQDLLWVEERVSERMDFDHIIFQKASAGISSNCGEGTFGLLYMVKGNHNYNLGSLFMDKGEEGDFIDDLSDDERDDYYEVTETEDEAVEKAEDISGGKWYDDIQGIDPAAALKNSGSEEALKSVLQMFYESYNARSEEIQGFYDQKDWENYTIKVHALKSSARLVGALMLGDKAEALEMAGKNSDIGFIADHHDDMMGSYGKMHDELSAIFGSEEDLPPIPEETLNDAYASLSELAQMKDFELVRMVVQSVNEYKLSPEDAERFQKIQTCLSRMDWDGINDILRGV